MQKLNRIILINAAGFDYLEFPVGGHSQVIGVNGHGKSTLLRTVLFFYLGHNEKSAYGLHETKTDFVSHYLGDPPAYLIFEVARAPGQPMFHIAATRPAGRIQFHFVDAPFLKDYYLDGNLVQPVERMEQRLRDARCAYDSVSSYEEFRQRIYGITPSPYAVFRPAARSSGQVSILPRIISGIFTVSQLDADKLKAALTCGVREDALATELDLVLLKNQLQNFRRVYRAVKTYLKYESDALQLVDIAEEFEQAKEERRLAIESLVRMAKRLPERNRELAEAQRALTEERGAALKQYQQEKETLDSAITELGKRIAVLTSQIKAGEEARSEYVAREIARKAAELESLPQLKETKRLAEEEYKALTAKFENESARKQHLLDQVQQSWTTLNHQGAQERASFERTASENLDKLNNERTEAFQALDDEQMRVKASFKARRAGLDYRRQQLNEEFKTLASEQEPAELRKSKSDLELKKQKHGDELLRLQGYRGEASLTRERRGRDREKLDHQAAAEQSGYQAKIAATKAKCDQAAAELEKFDGSLARFFQTDAPEKWPNAAKTLSRETLFHSARELDAHTAQPDSNTVWGVGLDPIKLPPATADYDRDRLAARLVELQEERANAQEQLTASQTRYLATVDKFEQEAAQAQNELQTRIDASDALRRSLENEIERLANSILNLDSQFQLRRKERRVDLEGRDAELKQEVSQLQQDDRESEDRFQERKRRLGEDFAARRKQVLEERDALLAGVERRVAEATRQRDADSSRIEGAFQESLLKQGVDEKLINDSRLRVEAAEAEMGRIEGYTQEVTRFQEQKRQFVDPLASLQSQLRSTEDSSNAERDRLEKLNARQQQLLNGYQVREDELKRHDAELRLDEGAVKRFRADQRFLQEWGYFDRDDLPPASYYRAAAVREFEAAAGDAHQKRADIEKQGEKSATTFLNHFDAETLDRKVLGFSPIHEHFNWFIFVGAELRPFVTGRGIQGMKQIQTQEFEQLIRNICAKNADFSEGIRQVRQTAAQVQANLEQNNFVDVLDSIELKVERVDNNLTRILTELESFAGMTFGADRDLFGKRPDGAQIEKAIETFARLVKEIENYKDKSLRLTDYFDFQIRVHENGHDMGWRRSLDHIGSTGTDYLVKVLIYLSLIEVYRERAIDPKVGSTVHCVLDETGVLAPKYVRSVLDYARERGIVLVTAGHSQQTVGFENWVRVRKRGQRFGGQTILRKVLQCD